MTDLTATERAVLAGLLAPEEDIETAAINADAQVWASLRGKFPAHLFTQWAAAEPSRYGWWTSSMPDDVEDTDPAGDPWWTVIGLYDQDSDEFVFAGVLAGRQPTSDVGGFWGRYQRMAHHVQAPTWQDAADQIKAQVEAPDPDPTAAEADHDA